MASKAKQSPYSSATESDDDVWRGLFKFGAEPSEFSENKVGHQVTSLGNCGSALVSEGVGSVLGFPLAEGGEGLEAGDRERADFIGR